MRRPLEFVALLSLLPLLALAGISSADVLINPRVGRAEYQPSACMITGPTRDGTGWWQNTMFIWRTTDGAGNRTYEAAVSGLSLSPVTALGVIPAPPGWAWHEDVQVRAGAGSTDMGSCCVCGMLRSTTLPRSYAVGTLRGYVPDSTYVLWDEPQVIPLQMGVLSSALYLGELAIDSHRESNFVTLVHPTNFTSPTPGYWMRQSYDGGATWSAAVPVGNDSLHAGAVHVQCGASPGDAWVIFGEINGTTQTLVSRRALPGGSGFLPPETVGSSAATFAFGPHTDQSSGDVATEANRDTLSGHANDLYMAATLGLLTPTSDFPAVSASPARNEVEPNGDGFAPLAVHTPGVVLRGTFAPTITPADTDWYSFDLAAGQFVSAWMDSATVGAVTQTSWMGQDGWTVLTGTYGNYQPVGFVAPTTGTWYLAVAGLYGTPPLGYRVRTLTEPTPASGGRDQGDLYLWQHNAGSWHDPGNVSASLGGTWTQESGVSLAANLDGYLYASWFDWGLVPGADYVRRMMARSPDGGTTWEAPVVLSSQPSWWSNPDSYVPKSVPPWALGLHNVIAHDGVRMCVPWTDARFIQYGQCDVFAAVVDRSLDVSSTGLVAYSPYFASSRSTASSVHPGDLVQVPVQIQSRDAYFGWRLPIEGTASRSWSIPPDQAVLGPLGKSGPIIGFTVPDTAAPGQVSVDIHVSAWTARSRPIGTVHLDLTVLPKPLAVGDRAYSLALAAPMPNPATTSTRIGFSLANASDVRLEIYGVDGRRVRTLERGVLRPGAYARAWAGDDDEGRRVSAGAYFVRLLAEGRTLTQRIAWMR